MPANFLRLRDGYRTGRLYATKAELAEFKSGSLIKLLRAEVLFETEQWDQAIAAYRRLAADERAGLNKACTAYLVYAQACAHLFSGRRDEARGLISGFVGPKPLYKDTLTYWRALFLLGNLDSDQQLHYLTEGANDSPNADLRLGFLLRMGQIYYTKAEDQHALNVFTRLHQLSDVDDYRHRAAANYIDLIMSRSPGLSVPK